jgi:hypothetical protein
MAVFFSSVSNSSAAVSPAVSYAAHEFSRFATGRAEGSDIFQPIVVTQPNATTRSTPAKKTSPWLMMAALTLLKLPFSFLAASTFNSWVFGITMSHSIQKELIGIGAEVLGTIGLKVFEERIGTDTHPTGSHEKQLEVASGIVSFIGTAITTAACIKDSKIWGPMRGLKKVGVGVASLAVGTLCGVVEGFFTAKLEPWLEKKLAR